jgi:hypothetical protein
MLLPYFLLGTAFGFVIVESEAVSWFRIQEMFRFDAFHMYGILSTAVLTAAVSVLIIKRLGVRDGEGTPLGFPPKTLGSGVRYLAGHGVRAGLGADRCVSRSDHRADRRRFNRHGRYAPERTRRHVDLRLRASQAPALNGCYFRDDGFHPGGASGQTSSGLAGEA